MSQSKRCGSFGALLTLFLAASAHVQGLATIVGRITDPSGAFLPGAKVTAKEDRTGFSRTSDSNIDGYYVLPSLRPAEYTLTVEANGFRRYVQQGLSLQVDQTATINVS